MAAYKDIIYQVKDRIATITMNRPDQLNAWTPIMGAELKLAMAEASEDSNVRVIVLTGAGRGFCSGADMSLLQNTGSGQGGESFEKPAETNYKFATENMEGEHSYFYGVPKPIIGAINGPAAGLGLVIALYCDVRLASTKSKYLTAFAQRGLIAEHGISWTLPKLIGLPNALDLLLSSRKIGAQEALQMGLVNRVIEDESFAEEVQKYAVHMATNVSPISLGVMKRELYQAQFQTLSEAGKIADADMAKSFITEDFKEGVAHYVEKRAPNFTGR